MSFSARLKEVSAIISASEIKRIFLLDPGMTEAFPTKQTMILLQGILLFIKTTPNFYLLTVIHEGIVKIGKQIIVSNIFITSFLSNTSSFVSV